MRLILPLLLAALGLAGGIGAGIFLAPEPIPEPMVELPPCGPGESHSADGQDLKMSKQEPEAVPKENMDADAQFAQDELSSTREYVKLNNQFVVPVVKDGRVSALVVMSLSLEVEVGGREAVFLREPKLRDLFLQVLFDHANAGGFDGNFTSGLNMAALRSGLVASAQQVLGNTVSGVLIQDIARQDA